MKGCTLTQFDTASFRSNVKVNGANFNATGYVLIFVFKSREDTEAVEQTCQWVDATVGRFQLKFDPTDLDVAGAWEGFFRLTIDSDVVHSSESFPFHVRARL